MILEVDENQHPDSSSNCDPRRDFDIFASATLGTRADAKIVVLRFNPDSFRIGDAPCTVPKKVRMARLLEAIGAEPPDMPAARWFMYYSKDKHEDALPSIARDWSEPVRQISRTLT